MKVIRRQKIIIKAGRFLTPAEKSAIRATILEQLSENGVALISGDYEIVTVDADIAITEPEG